MDAAIAETVARATRERADDDARTDLKEMRRRAVEAGRERSRKITKTSRIDPRTGEIRYNPAGRLLRDWYLHVYLNTLRANLGEPSIPTDAQQVEDTTSLLRKLRPEASAYDTVQAVGVIRNVAVADAARAAAEIVDGVYAVGARRAIQHARDDRFDADQLRVHVVRHWYLRCYEDHIERVTLSQQPLTGVTRGEEVQVALVLETRVPRRLIGRDGVPLVNAHGTLVTEVDRRLAEGQTHVVASISDPGHHTDPRQNLRTRVTRTWADLDTAQREQWLGIARIENESPTSGWTALRGESQSKLIQLYLGTHMPSQIDMPFEPPTIKKAPSEAARLMFGHRAPLDESPHALELSVDSHRSSNLPFSEADGRTSVEAGPAVRRS